MSASLIGHLGSSTFRLSTTTVSMSLTGSCFSSEPESPGGRRLKVKSVRAPRPRYWNGDPESFAASYLNAYVANGAVVSARFGDPERDRAARRALAQAFPARDVIMLRIDHIADGGGGVHCLTQPMPRVRRNT